MVDRSRQAVSATGSGGGDAGSRALRVRARIEAGYEDSLRQVFLPTLNLSESGVFLLSSELPAIGSQAQVVLELPGHEAFLRLRGSVIRVQTEPFAGFAVSFETDAGNAEALAALRQFVRHEMSVE
jgi:hypothetical protein